MEYPNQFICATREYATHENPVPAPLFRTPFFVEEVKSIQLVICGLGFYRAFCNGMEVTSARLCSCPSNPNQIVYYETYDLTQFVRPGKNVLCVLLGNGMLNSIGGAQWAFDIASFRAAPKTAFRILENGRCILTSDTSVKVHPSAILYNDLREGESYDARLEIPACMDPDFDASDWECALEAKTPKGVCAENGAPAIHVSKEWKPVSVKKVPGGHIYEFPINTAGICRLRLNGKAGQMITMQHVEALDSAGRPFIGNLVFGCTARTQHDVYICKDGWQTWEPSFTYHGFRYVYVTGLTDEQATNYAVIQLQLCADLQRRANFQTSDTVVMQLCSMIDNSNLSNLLHIPTDCPQREKNGWSGDISVSAHQMCLQYDMRGMFGEWMRQYCLSQREDGALPGFVPTGEDGYEVWTGPSWSMSLFLCAEYLYRYHGDLNFARKSATTMERYLAYVIAQRRSDGMISFGLGDWCQTGVYYADRFTTPNEITDTLATLNMLQIAIRLFTKLGRPCDHYKVLADQIRSDFRSRWMEKNGWNCLCRTQTAQAMVLYYDLVDAEFQSAAVNELVRRIDDAGNVMNVGILGGYVLFDVLSKYGHADLAYKLITQIKAPSYGYFAARGETTLRESLMGHGMSQDSTVLQNGKTISSLNHHFWGFIYTWFVENIAGVSINPDCENADSVVIRVPTVPKEYTKFSYPFFTGTMDVCWRKDAATFCLYAQIPDGVTAFLVTEEGSVMLSPGRHEKRIFLEEVK